MQDMTGKQHLEEVNEEADVEFKWGDKLEVDEQDPAIQLYESFVYDGIEYSLFDCVYLWHDDKYSIGKLVKIWETRDHKRMVDVVWFFRPEEIGDSFGDNEPLSNELFLASGEGRGLSNVNTLEAISGKCNVVCTSKDRRNPQASDVELSMADFIFSRTFDVGRCRAVDTFPDTIAGTEVEYFFNRRDQGLLYPGISPPHVNESVEILTRPANVQQPESVGEKFNCNKSIEPASHSGQEVHFSDKNDETQSVGISSESKALLKHFKDFSVKYIPENQNVKRMKYLAVSEDLDMQSNGSPSPKLSQKCSTQILQGKKSGSKKGDLDTMDSAYNQKISKGKTIVQKVTKFANEEAPRFLEDNKVKTKRHFTEVNIKPYNEKCNWFREQPWEEKVQRANERGTLILLESLDPSFSSSEIEDLVWQCIGEKVEAKMIEPIFFSSPHYGRALVIFKSQVAAEFAISELEKRCLMLEYGRTVVGRRVTLGKTEKSITYVGHLFIPKVKLKQQREEMRNAKSTSHCSQSNTIEYDMAMEWCLLQEQSDKWWNLIQEEQEREMQKVRSQLKIWPKD